MDNERKTLTFDQLPQAVGELLDKVDGVICRLDKMRDADTAPPEKDDNKVMSLDEACQFIGKARSTMYSLTSENRIPYRKCGNKLYFFKKELVEWIKNGGICFSTDIPEDKSHVAFEAHAMELRSQKKNKPSTIKSRKEDGYGRPHA